MNRPTYITLPQARAELEKMGIELSGRQMSRAAEMDAAGHRKLPFFVDPIDRKLKIEKGALRLIYQKLQVDAENNLRN